MSISLRPADDVRRAQQPHDDDTRPNAQPRETEPKTLDFSSAIFSAFAKVVRDGCSIESAEAKLAADALKAVAP